MIFSVSDVFWETGKIVIDYASINVVHNICLLQVEGLGYRFPTIHVPIIFMLLIGKDECHPYTCFNYILALSYML